MSIDIEEIICRDNWYIYFVDNEVYMVVVKYLVDNSCIEKCFSMKNYFMFYIWYDKIWF